MSHGNKRILSTFSEKSNVNGEYPQPEFESHSIAIVLCVISDEKSLSFFRSIANSSDSTSVGHQPIDESRISMSHINLTPSQYYSRINRLRSMGFINRRQLDMVFLHWEEYFLKPRIQYILQYRINGNSQRLILLNPLLPKKECLSKTETNMSMSCSEIVLRSRTHLCIVISKNEHLLLLLNYNIGNLILCCVINDWLQ